MPFQHLQKLRHQSKITNHRKPKNM